GEAALDEFSEVGWVGVQDAGAGLLAWQRALFCEQGEGMCWFHHTRQVDHRPDVRTGSRQADIAERATRTGTDLHNVIGCNVMAEEGGDGGEGEVDAQFIL